MDVACFCGYRFSCGGDVGTCPDSGEYVTPSGVSDTEEKQMRAELDLMLTYCVAARGPRVRVLVAAGDTKNEFAKGSERSDVMHRAGRSQFSPATGRGAIPKLTVTQRVRHDGLTGVSADTDTLNEPVDHHRSARVAVVSQID